VISVILAAIGGGIVEVLVSPIVEACPTEEKSSAMSLLHSFYSWGLAGVVLLSTLFFAIVGIEHWRILSCLWALIPAAGAVAFCLVPLAPLESLSGDPKEQPSHSLFRNRLFWIFFVIMFCAGASEMSMIQWVSSFAETGLKIPKALGDLMGPCAFAILMGGVRTFYGRSEGKLSLSRFILVSSILCVLSYLIAALSPFPLLSLVGCALCGLSVAIMWPGTYSLASARIPYGGVRMFAILAMAGDIGCLVGPTLAGWIAELFGNNLRVSFLFSSLFPLLIILLMVTGLKQIRKNHK
jgi:fucose permease